MGTGVYDRTACYNCPGSTSGRLRADQVELAELRRAGRALSGLQTIWAGAERAVQMPRRVEACCSGVSELEG